MNMAFRLDPPEITWGESPEVVLGISTAAGHVMEGHVERPERFASYLDNEEGYLRLDYSKLELRKETGEQCRLATAEEIELVHDDGYIARLEAAEPALGEPPVVVADEFDPDGVTFLTSTTIRDARLALGTTLSLVDQVFMKPKPKGKHLRPPAFAVVRPPGHHATRSRPMGFCIFNTVAVAAAYAKKQYGVKRVLIVDFDLHNGNGTADVFYEDPDVVVIDIHEELNVYCERDREEDTGAGAGAGLHFNIPLKAGAGVATVWDLCENIIPGIAARVKPQLVLVSAGFDGHAKDPFNTTLGRGLAFDEHCYELFGRCLKGIADNECDGRIVFVVEGGYNPKSLADSLHWLREGALNQDAERRPERWLQNDADRASSPVLERVYQRMLAME